MPEGGERLVFTFVGFRSSTVSIDGRTTINVELEADVLGLDEVVVTGLATSVKRRNLANSVGTISEGDLVPVPAQTLERALSGKIAGLSVSQNSGAPGGGLNVNLRGTSTITGSTQPLYVVDGMLTDDISFLNSQDIESVEVLKDASATAIYGSRGANGVIIISTKTGQRGEGTTFNASVYRGVQEVMNPIDLTNAQQYATLANELRENQGQSPAFENPSQFGQGRSGRTWPTARPPSKACSFQRAAARRTSRTALAATTWIRRGSCRSPTTGG